MLQINISMGAAKPLVNEINQYLNRLSVEQQKAILTVVKTFAQQDEVEWWKDKEYMTEMSKRVTELQSSTATGSTWEEVKLKAKSTGKQAKINELPDHFSP